MRGRRQCCRTRGWVTHASNIPTVQEEAGRVCMCADGRTDGRTVPLRRPPPRRLGISRPASGVLLRSSTVVLICGPDSLEPLGVERDPQRRRRDAKHILCLSAVVSSQRLLVVVIAVTGLTMYSHLQFNESKQKLQAAQLALRLMATDTPVS